MSKCRLVGLNRRPIFFLLGVCSPTPAWCLRNIRRSVDELRINCVCLLLFSFLGFDPPPSGGGGVLTSPAFGKASSYIDCVLGPGLYIGERRLRAAATLAAEQIAEGEHSL